MDVHSIDRWSYLGKVVIGPGRSDNHLLGHPGLTQMDVVSHNFFEAHFGGQNALCSCCAKHKFRWITETLPKGVCSTTKVVKRELGRPESSEPSKGRTLELYHPFAQPTPSMKTIQLPQQRLSSTLTQSALLKGVTLLGSTYLDQISVLNFLCLSDIMIRCTVHSRAQGDNGKQRAESHVFHVQLSTMSSHSMHQVQVLKCLGLNLNSQWADSIIIPNSTCSNRLYSLVLLT
jgi:hypothetical protein